MNNVRRLFLRFLGVIYLVAFLSLWPQVLGLIGSNGMLPAQHFLEAVRERFGTAAAFTYPGVFWLGAGDILLKFWCGAGIFLAALLVIGFAPVPVLALLWAVYLSFFTVCRDFLSFQWDILLLEMGFLAIFFAPLGFGRKSWEEERPSEAVLWLLRWLLFRLMFASGAMKWLSGDATWRSLTALKFYYETQPLPPWTAWFAHHLPEGFQKASVAGMFFIELAVPFCIFAPRKIRFFACGAFVFLQLFIMATGNYCFFNWLTLALCLLLLDDRVLPLRSKESLKPSWPRWIIGPVAGFIIFLSTFQFLYGLRLPVPWPKAIVRAAREVSPWCFANHYGLFAVMTTQRPEIRVEGSDDGIHWQAYEFKYKPGDLDRVPRFVAPHQPRLDWQMWFAALGHFRQNPWFVSFCKRLLQGSPDVLSLLAKNPFPDKPPRYLRAMITRYHFTTPEERRRSGRFWRRDDESELYLPPVSL
ncbi:MAG: lipase maturation factor family protein [Candidatus Omnitrophota bacterium]